VPSFGTLAASCSIQGVYFHTASGKLFVDEGSTARARSPPEFFMAVKWTKNDKWIYGSMDYI
jgi:hypothetical protein